MRTITLLISALLYSIIGVAQTYYYLEPKTFQEKGYTYQCDLNGYQVTLYNKENKLTYEDNIDKRTGRLYVPNGKGSHIASENKTKPQCYSIVNQAFSPEQKLRVKGQNIIIRLCISPQTGDIMEVDFNLIAVKQDPYQTIPVSVFRQIEVELKKNVRFIPSAEGKNMSYILLCWSQDPNETIKESIDDIGGGSEHLGPIGGGDGDVDDNPIRKADSIITP